MAENIFSITTCPMADVRPGIMIHPPLGHYDPGTTSMKRSPGSYQRLDLFIKVVRVLCPNLTDASHSRPSNHIDCWSWERLSWVSMGAAVSIRLLAHPSTATCHMIHDPPLFSLRGGSLWIWHVCGWANGMTLTGMRFCKESLVHACQSHSQENLTDASHSRPSNHCQSCDCWSWERLSWVSMGAAVSIRLLAHP